jgi:hypothetical protein
MCRKHRRRWARSTVYKRGREHPGEFVDNAFVPCLGPGGDGRKARCPIMFGPTHTGGGFRVIGRKGQYRLRGRVQPSMDPVDWSTPPGTPGHAQSTSCKISEGARLSAHLHGVNGIY